MRIGILTWYKEINHGAVLQAYASQMNLRKKGVEAGLLDYNRKAQINLNKIQLLSIRIKRLFSGDYRYRKVYSVFRQEKQKLFGNFVKNNVLVWGNYADFQGDGVMVGSDMVFNLIEGYAPYMFGVGVKTNYIFSYAASAGGSTIELAEKLGIREEIAKALCRFNKLGCRDQSTKEFVSQISGIQDLFDNIDPVLLYGFKEEMETWNTKKWGNHDPYVLIYAYHGNLNSKKEVESIRRWADANGLKIVSCGNYHSWCDESANVDPKEFLEMFIEASAVITDTFHGTVFSMICEKKFCSIIRGNAFKLKHLLVQAGLEEQIASGYGQIEEIMNRDIDYKDCRKWLTEAREHSQQYIDMCLSEMSCENILGE